MCESAFIVPFCEWIGAELPSALCACLDMSWGDLYIALYILILFSHKQTFYIRNCSKVALDVSDRMLTVEQSVYKAGQHKEAVLAVQQSGPNSFHLKFTSTQGNFSTNFLLYFAVFLHIEIAFPCQVFALMLQNEQRDGAV